MLLSTSATATQKRVGRTMARRFEEHVLHLKRIRVRENDAIGVWLLSFPCFIPRKRAVDDDDVVFGSGSDMR